MTTLKKNLKKNLSLKKNLKKNLSLKKSLKKVSGKENKSMRGGAWRPPRYRRPPPPQTYASKPQPPSMSTIYQKYNSGNGQQRIPSAERYEPKYIPLPKPSPQDSAAYKQREAMTTMQRRENPLTQQQKKAFRMVREELLHQQWLARHPNE